jgi:hypothetical protein
VQVLLALLAFLLDEKHASVRSSSGKVRTTHLSVLQEGTPRVEKPLRFNRLHLLVGDG